MHLSLILPPVQPEGYPAISECPYADCGGQHVQHWQTVAKPLRDTQLHEVEAQRYRCVRCGRTFRVYPAGVSHDQTSARLKGVAVMFYGLGMS
jgi:transposase-like protein